MPSIPVRFTAGAVLGLLLLAPGTLDESASSQAIVLFLGALTFGLWSVRRADRFWTAVGRRFGGS